MRIKTAYLFFILFAISLVSYQRISCADTPIQTPLITAAADQVLVEKARNTLFANRLQVLHQHTKQKSNQVDGSALRRIDLTITSTRQDLEGINLTLMAAQQADQLTQSNIQSLQDQLQSSSLLTTTTESQTDKLQTQLQAQLKEQQALHDLQGQRIAILQSTQALARQTLEAGQEWSTQLQTDYQLQQAVRRQAALDSLAMSLQQNQQEWLKRLAALNQQLQKNNASDLLSNPAYMQLQMNILEAEEGSNLSEIQLDLARIRNGLEDLDVVPGQKQSVTALNLAQQQASVLLQHLTDMNTMLSNKVSLLQNRRQTTLQQLQTGIIPGDIGQSILSIVDSLLTSYKEQLASATDLIKQANTIQQAVMQKLNQQLASRQGLPGYDRLAWWVLGEKLRQIPYLVSHTFRDLYKNTLQGINDASPWQWGVGVIALIAWGFLWAKFRRYLSVAIKSWERLGDRYLTNQVLLMGVRLVSRHLIGLMLLGALYGLLFLFALPIVTFSVVLDLIWVLVVFRIILSLTHFLLMESEVDKGGHDVRLYHRLRWILSIGGVITALVVLMQHLPIAYGVQDLFGRLFMLFLLVVAIVLLRTWVKLPALIGPYLENKRPYLIQLVRWLTLLVPLSIFSNALLGLIGYIELAWSMAAYQGVFLMVLTSYLLLSGLLGELMRFVAEHMIRNLRNGWLWSEAILKPLHWVLRMTLFLLALSMLFGWYGWGQQSWVVTHIDEFLNLNLFTFSGSVIRPINIILLILIIAIFVWATRWIREFTFRWLFAGTKDAGLRNSLAIFSQYTMVGIGVIIALHISGINLTALTVVASLFAAGIGFGLRDLANNFMSGILLLIERPVQVGDYVTIGTFEGEVKHIGMRSITVLTDNYQDLLVPNANVFSQPFINWTRHNNVVRTVVILRFSRVDDPHRMKEVILEVLKSVPKVLTDPAPEVYLKEMDEVLLKFQVGYYVDMRSVFSLSSMRSYVLYALWDRFKAEGIHSPDVIQELYIRGELQQGTAQG